jgi:hypothetical protein
MKKSKLQQIIKEEIRRALNENYEMGDSININIEEFPNYKFPYGISGRVISVDKADYASDDVVYTIELKHIEPTGDIMDKLLVDNPRMIK